MGGRKVFWGIRRSTGPAVPWANQKADGKRRTGLTLRHPKGEILGFSPELLKSHQETCSLQTKEETRAVHCWTYWATLMPNKHWETKSTPTLFSPTLSPQAKKKTLQFSEDDQGEFFKTAAWGGKKLINKGFGLMLRHGDPLKSTWKTNYRKLKALEAWKYEMKESIFCSALALIPLTKFKPTQTHKDASCKSSAVYEPISSHKFLCSQHLHHSPHSERSLLLIILEPLYECYGFYCTAYVTCLWECMTFLGADAQMWIYCKGFLGTNCQGWQLSCGRLSQLRSREERAIFLWNVIRFVCPADDSNSTEGRKLLVGKQVTMFVSDLTARGGNRFPDCVQVNL